MIENERKENIIVERKDKELAIKKGKKIFKKCREEISTGKRKSK